MYGGGQEGMVQGGQEGKVLGGGVRKAQKIFTYAE